MKDSNGRKILGVIILVILCFVFLGTRATFMSYESLADASVNGQAANWKILIDNQDITTIDTKEIAISDVVWNQDHVREGKIAPGSTGKMNILIDPADTEVAIRCDFTIIDKNVDDTKYLVVNGMSADGITFVETKKGVYTGVISLEDIKNGVKPIITLDLEWKSNPLGDVMSDEVLSGKDFMEIDFQASQYNGEPILSYDGN